MATRGGVDGPDDGALLAVFRAISSGDRGSVGRRVGEEPGLAKAAIRTGATRQDPDTHFLRSIHHYVYAGDTALHVASAAHDRALAELFVAHGADVHARNRRGAEPLHYAADGRTGAADWDRDGQKFVITYLIEVGADPDAMDKSGVAPMHRAVRTRSSDAVRALIEGGANPRLRNKSGSTPLHLAVQNTGKGNSGSDVAREEQRKIIALLLEHGAGPSDVDANGKTVAAAATSDWIRHMLDS